MMHLEPLKSEDVFKMMARTINIFVVLFLVIVSTPALLQAQHLHADSLFAEARQAARNGNRQKARALCEQILKAKPDYHEVRVYLGRLYAWDRQYSVAWEQLSRVLYERPDYREALAAMTDVALWAGRYADGLRIVDQALRYYPNDDDFLIKKARFLIKLENKKEAARQLVYVLERHPSHPEALKWLHVVRSSAPLNKLAMYYVADVFDRGTRAYGPWHLVSAELSRRLPLGSVFLRTNYAHRKFGSTPKDGFQFEIDAYPKIARGMYFYLNGGYSSSSVFPDFRLGGEFYLSLGKGFEASAGIRYLDFGSSDVTIYTGTLGKYYKRLWFSVRPFITPKNVGTSFSMQVLVRWYFGNADSYITLSTGAGSTPVEVDTQAELQRLNSQKLGMNWQHLYEGSTIVKLGVSYEYEEFRPGEFGKRYTFTLSLQQRF